MKKRHAVLTGLFVLLLSGSWIWPQEDKFQKKTFEIPKINSEIKIDGALDEEKWQQALVVPVNIEIMPAENVEAPVKTDCYLMHDLKNLYVGFMAYDPEPDKIRAYLSDRDNAWSDDNVGILLDTFNDENRAFIFMANPLGVQGDEIMSQGGSQEDDSWDAIWDSAGRITDFGYCVEMAIPFRSLQFQPSLKEQFWGFGPIRNYPRSRRHQISNFNYNRNNQCIICQLHRLKGFENATPGRNIELDPTITGVRTDQRENFPSGDMKKDDASADVGISGHWGFSNNLTLSAALNPDFSQIEADVAQLDINKQFALYYPEKRPFFLEGTDFFDTSLNAVHTRSVADPDWGAKISGKEGKNAFGFFSAQDNITNLIFPGAEGSNQTSLEQVSYANVLRYRRDVGNASTLGILLTDREGKDYHNRVAGVDGLVRINKSDALNFQIMGSQTAYPQDIAHTYDQEMRDFTGHAAYLGFRREKRSYGIIARFMDCSPGFRADLGYMPQVDYRRYVAGGYYMYWGKENDFFTRMGVDLTLLQTENHGGDLLDRKVEANINFEGPHQSFLMWEVTKEKQIYQGKAFSQFSNFAYFRIIPSGNLNLNINIGFGDEIDFENVRPGKSLFMGPTIEIKTGRHVRLRLSHVYNRLNVEGERLFTYNLTQLRFVYHLNRRLFFRTILQYWDVNRNAQLYSYSVDPEYNRLFSQILFSYKLNPRTVLFLGYSDNYYGYRDVDLTQSNRTFFLKIGYAWSL
jgi:hypothetical protein